MSMCNFAGADEIDRALVNIFVIGDKGPVKDRLFEKRGDVSFLKVVKLAASKSASKPFSSVAVKSDSEVYHALRNHVHVLLDLPLQQFLEATLVP